MPAVRIDALCQCDGCSKRFGVELDLGEKLKGGFSEDFEMLVREAIRGGQTNFYTWGVRGKNTVDRISLSGFPTIQADLMLCDRCTKLCDDLPIDRDLTRTEVEKALNLPWGPDVE